MCGQGTDQTTLSISSNQLLASASVSSVTCTTLVAVSMTKEVEVFGASFAGVRSMLPLNLNSSEVHMRRSEKRKKTLRRTRMVEKMPLV